MKSWVIFLGLFVLVACAKVPAQVQVNESVNVTPSAPVVDDALGRFVVLVGAEPDTVSVDEFTIQLADLEVYDAVTDSWKKVLSAKKSFELGALEGTHAVLIDTPLDVAKFTKLRFRLNNVDAVKELTEYDVSVPYSTVTMDADVRVEKGKTAVAELVFDPSTLVLVGSKGYWKVGVRVETKEDARVTITDSEITILGGTMLTSEKNGVLDLYSEAQIANLMGDCAENCGDDCLNAVDPCTNTCEDAVESGCDSEDEDICRETCEGYMSLVDCREGCRKDDAAECTDYLVPRCSLGCTDTYADCNTTCTNNCR